MEASELINTQAAPALRIPTINANAIRPLECLREGKALIEQQYWPLVGACFVGYFIAGMAPLYLLYGPMMCGLSYCFLRLEQGERFQFSDLFKGFDHFGPGFFVGLVQMLPAIVVAIPLYIVAIVGNMFWAMRQGAGADPGEFPALLVGGFLAAWLLVIAVSVVSSLLFGFSDSLVVEWKLPAGQALKLSVQAVRANLGGTIGLMFLTSLVMLAGLLVFGIGIYLAMPVSHAAWTVAYRQAFPPYPHHLDVPPDPPVWAEWKSETTVET